ncbi:MAG TPA: hypothetical protein QGF05_00955 [Dehalococcoidia bacterium]|nr:hypothetical protein [Dehalococcoidia bacterium]
MQSGRSVEGFAHSALRMMVCTSVCDPDLDHVADGVQNSIRPSDRTGNGRDLILVPHTI